MARDFDGTNDRLSFGSDASIDQFVALGAGLWFQRDVQNATVCLIAKDRAVTGWALLALNNAGSNRIEFWRQWSGANALWSGGSVDTGLHHIWVDYDGGATTNDPTVYL